MVTGTRIKGASGGPSPVKRSDSASDGGYQPTGNYLDLWGLGPIRALVLEDGHRVPSTYFDGTVDIDTLPQLLVKRVEAVTGGANFIIDKDFNGIKIGERAHVEWSAEYFHRDGISAMPRPFGSSAVSIVGSGTAASPLQQVANTRLNTSTFGGLVTTGPFKGQQFPFDVTGGYYQASSSNPGLIYPAAPFADQIGRYVSVGLRFGH